MQEETAKFWQNMFAEEGIRPEEKDIWEYLGEKAGQEAKKVTDKEREEMDKDITLEDIEETVKNLKSDKACTLALLIHHKDTLTPYVLDPTLEKCEELYAKGLMVAEGLNQMTVSRPQGKNVSARKKLGLPKWTQFHRSCVKWRAKREHPGIHLRALQPALPTKGRTGSPLP